MLCKNLRTPQFLAALSHISPRLSAYRTEFYSRKAAGQGSREGPDFATDSLLSVPPCVTHVSIEPRESIAGKSTGGAGGGEHRGTSGASSKYANGNRAALPPPSPPPYTTDTSTPSVSRHVILDRPAHAHSSTQQDAYIQISSHIGTITVIPHRNPLLPTDSFSPPQTTPPPLSFSTPVNPHLLEPPRTVTRCHPQAGQPLILPFRQSPVNNTGDFTRIDTANGEGYGPHLRREHGS